MTAFHKQVLVSWTEIYCSKPFTIKEVLNEYILYNKYITIAKRTISVERFPNNLGHNVKIIDMLDNSGDLLKRTKLNKRLGSNLSQMRYNSLVSAIPNEWKIKIKEKLVNVTDRLTDDIRLTCNNVLVSLEKITSKNYTMN